MVKICVRGIERRNVRKHLLSGSRNNSTRKFENGPLFVRLEIEIREASG